MKKDNLPVNLTILKSPTPIIWLDTSILFDIVRWKQNKSLSDAQKEKRIPILYNSIYELVRKEKLICPEADQKEENEKFGLGLLRNVLSDLSLGVRFLHSNSIRERQKHIHMNAYVSGKREIEINYRHAFLNDPQKTVIETKSAGRILRVDITSQTDIDKVIEERKGYSEQFEALRLDNQEKNISYDDELEKEYLDFHDFILNEIDYYVRNLRNPFINTTEILRMGACRRLIANWSRLSKKECDIAGLLEFSESDFYRCTPATDISCRLSALIVTGTKEIESGDYMDIKQLSTVIPYCNTVITDRVMCHNLRSLGIDSGYNTSIFSLRDFDEIMKCLYSI